MFGSTYIQFNKICSLQQGCSGSMCKVDHQGLSYVKVLIETRVLNPSLVCLISNNSFLALFETMVRIRIGD